MRRPASTRALWALVTSGMLAALAASGCGGGGQAGERSDPFEAVQRDEQAATRRARAEAAPRWEAVSTLRGSGNATKTIRIKPDAVQWRVRWRCTKGGFQVATTTGPAAGEPFGAGRCPGAGEAEAIDTGQVGLAVRTAGSWRAVVEQQVTDPIAEPPLPAMEDEDAKVVASGPFYPIEKRGQGKAVLHRLPGGRLALRLEDFDTFTNTDLFVWLSRAKRPRSTTQALRAKHTEFARLKSTIGDQNYLLPKGTDADSIRSIVIWCEPVRIAYTAATLRR